MRFAKYILRIVLISFLLVVVVIYGILACPKGFYKDSYQSLIQDKFQMLLDTNEPKIVIVGGSNCAFGIDQKMIEDATGYKVVNLGLHAGFGHLFYSELSKANINPGDIILLAYEYNWPEEGGFTDVDCDLIMSGIDDDLKMYTYLPEDMLYKIMGNIIPYASRKANAEFDRNGVYSRRGFDPDTLQMTGERNQEFHFDPNINGSFSIQDVHISESSREYLTEYKELVESKGASVYFVSIPVAKSSIACDYDEFYKLKDLEEQEIGIEYISDPTDYFYDDELFLILNSTAMKRDRRSGLSS